MSTAIAVRHQLSPPGVTADKLSSVTVSNSGAINSKMPHTNHSVGAGTASSAAPSSPGDDFGSTDEVKVFKDEGDKEDEQSCGENLLLEEKSSLIDLTESEVSADAWWFHQPTNLLTQTVPGRRLTNFLLMTLFLLKFPHFTFPQDKSDKPSSRQDHSPVYGKDVHHPPGFNVGYLVSPYPYANGAAASMVSVV